MKKAKKITSFRLSETTIRELAALAKLHGVSQAEIIAVLTHCFSLGLDPDEWENYLEIVSSA